MWLLLNSKKIYSQILFIRKWLLCHLKPLIYFGKTHEFRLIRFVFKKRSIVMKISVHVNVICVFALKIFAMERNKRRVKFMFIARIVPFSAGHWFIETNVAKIIDKLLNFHLQVQVQFLTHLNFLVQSEVEKSRRYLARIHASVSA